MASLRLKIQTFLRLVRATSGNQVLILWNPEDRQVFPPTVLRDEKKPFRIATLVILVCFSHNPASHDDF